MVLIRRKPEVCVGRRNLRWEVSVNGRTRPMIDWLCTKERAVDHAVECAVELASFAGRPVVVGVTNLDGSVEEELVVDVPSLPSRVAPRPSRVA